MRGDSGRRARSTVVFLAASTGLLAGLAGCGSGDADEAAPVRVPGAAATSSPAGPVGTASPSTGEGTSGGDATTPPPGAPAEEWSADGPPPPPTWPPALGSVRYEGVAVVDDRDEAVLAVHGAFWDDWMDVVAAPGEPPATSPDADLQGQQVLVARSQQQLEGGNDITGTLILDAPSVAYDEAGGLATVLACIDQAELVATRFDGSVAPPEAQDRVPVLTTLSTSGERWLVSGAEIGGPPC